MRRSAFACLVLLAFALPLSAASADSAAAAADPIVCPLPPSPRLGPDELWKELMAGNAVFVDGDVHYAGLRPLRRAMADWQAPPVAVVSCADSRVMPEVTFDRTVGELFVTRVAGNLAPELDLASLEFSIANGWSSLIVVMGHSDCGAIRAALRTTDPPTPPLKALVAQIRKAFAGIPRTDSPTAEQLRRATDANTRHVAKQLTVESPLLRACVDARKLTIVTAYYDVGSGKVERLP